MNAIGKFIPKSGAECRIKQLADLGEAEPEPLATQSQLETNPILFAVDTGLSFSGGVEQSLILIKADAARRNIKFPSQLTDAVAPGFILVLVHTNFLAS